MPQEELSSSENAALDGMDMDIIDIDAVGLEEAEDKEEGEGEAAAAGDDLIFDDTDEEEASNLKSYLEWKDKSDITKAFHNNSVFDI